MAFFSMFQTFFTTFQTAIQTRSKIRVPQVKIELGLDVIDTEPDANIAIYLAAVKEKADVYCGNTFLDLSGNPFPIPATIEGWIIKETCHLYNYQHGVSQENAPHIGWIKWAENLDYTIISHWRINPGF